MTHRHDLDEAITEAILRRGDAAFCGLIGSATKRARFLSRFEARGLNAAQLGRLTCPIGLPGIAGKEPAVLAVSVVAQLLGCPASQRT
jgi:xanthine dehydrogenase accessory factor